MKTAVVTGANSGMGKITANALMEKGYELIIVCRSAEKGQATLKELKERFPEGKVELMLADLSSVKEVQRLGEEIKKRLSSLDVLVNNAGAINSSREETVDGYERTFATNHLAYFQLGNALVDLLKKSPDGRMVNIASMAQWLGKLEWDDLQMKKKYNGLQAYCNSKMMNIMYTYALADRLQGTNVKVNAVHPGGVNTSFGKNSAGVIGFWAKKLEWTMRSAEKGADTAIWLAVSEEAAQYSGLYFTSRKPVRSRLETYRVENLEKLWSRSEELINAKLQH
ncbi:MAG: SDR family oxidoreductase [Bacteroidales bacterium]